VARDVVASAPPAREGSEVRARGLGLAQYAGFLPALVLYGAFFAAPLGLIVAYSFWTVVDYNVVHDWTLDNYRYFFSVSTYVRTFWATIWVSVAATAATILIAFPFAYWLARYVPRRVQGLLLVLVILPFWTSYLLRVYSWLNILGDQGAINRFLQWTHVTDEPVSFFLYDRPAVILVLVYLYFPFAALTLYASLERFDWEQFKAARDLGATSGTAIRRILLPQIKPGLVTSVIFVFIPILGEYLAPQLVGGAKGVMIGNLIVNFFQGAQYTRGAAAALLIATLIVILLVIFRRSLEVRDAYGA
jgi:ABC-type spermidine/putrescine transport system permease subunit I